MDFYLFYFFKIGRICALFITSAPVNLKMYLVHLHLKMFYVAPEISTIRAILSADWQKRLLNLYYLDSRLKKSNIVLQKT